MKDDKRADIRNERTHTHAGMHTNTRAHNTTQRQTANSTHDSLELLWRVLILLLARVRGRVWKRVVVGGGTHTRAQDSQEEGKVLVDGKGLVQHANHAAHRIHRVVAHRRLREFVRRTARTALTH